MIKWIFIVFVLLVGCSESGPPPPPTNAMSEQQFVEVMVDVHLLEATVNHQFVKVADTSGVYHQYYAHLFGKHQIDRAIFDSTFNYYLRHPKLMNTIYKQVHDSLKALAIDLEENEEKYRQMERDTAQPDTAQPVIRQSE